MSLRSPQFQVDGALFTGADEAAAAMRSHDWAGTALGPPAGWASSLKTAVRLLLGSRHPTVIFWGADGAVIHNEAARLAFGLPDGSVSFGRPGREILGPLWKIVSPQIEAVLAGRDGTWREDELAPVTRRGRREEVYWTYSCAPLDDGSAPTGIGGVLMVCTETTRAVLAERRRREAIDRQRRLFEQAPGFMCILRGPDHVFEFVNNAHKRLFNSARWIGQPVRKAFPDVAGQGYYEHLDRVFVTGERHVAKSSSVRFRRTPDGAMEERLLDFIYEPVTDDFGQITGIFCEGFDVTEQRRAEEALRANQARQALTLELLRGQRESEDPEAMMRLAAEAVGRHLGANRVGFVEIAEGDTLRFGPSWADGVLAPLVGGWPAENMGTRYLAEIRMGRTLAITDTENDPLTWDSRFRNIGTRSLIGAPILRGGRWRAGCYVNHAGPRAWSEEDVALVRDVADLTWTAVERARAVAALRESETQLRLATEAAEIGLWDLDMVAGSVFWQPRVKAMFGISAEAALSRADYHTGLHPDDRARDSAAFAAATDPARRELYDVEYRTVGKEDGVTRWVAAKGRGIFDENGRCVRVIGTAIDITARKRDEQRLRELNEILERRVAEALAERKILADIVESTDAFIQVADTQYRWLAINRASADEFERIFGVRPKPGDNMLQVLSARPEQQAAVKEVWSRALAGEEFTAIGQFGDPSLSRRSYEMKFNTLRDRDGTIIGAYQFVYDVTERLRDQARLAEAEEHLRQAQKIEAIGQLTGGVAHDFNNLLMVISGGLGVLDRQKDPERRRRILDGMRQAAARGASLSRQLLAFSRRQPLRPEPVDLARQIDNMGELLDRTLRGDVQVETRFPPDLWPVVVDPAELELALLNLCVNARDAMPKGGVITVSARNLKAFHRGALSGDFVSLSVTDTGVGMSKEVLARVFEPFFTTKDVGKGSGLGLAQVYGFARQSGGHAEVDSAVGRGTTATFYLPRSKVAPVELARRPAEPEDRPASPCAGAVLMVEDDDEVAALVAEMLDQLGYRVTRAASGEGALGALADERAIDIVFSDVMMPGGMNGVELAREIRRRRPGLPVLLTSGFAEAAQPDARIEGIEVLAKPYQIDDLAAALSRAVVATQAL